MEIALSQFLSKRLQGISGRSASAVLELAAEGATVPFIARYRKERTGNLDEVQIREVIDANQDYLEITKRREFLLKEIGSQGNLTEELSRAIESSWDLIELEEIYRPFKKKKKTKATLAREAGLQPLANWLWDVGHGVVKAEVTMEVEAKKYLNIEKGIVSYELALNGAKDIIVEKIASEPELRRRTLAALLKGGRLASKRAKGYKANSKYQMYAEFSDKISALLETKASHRYLAMKRGWEEEELTLEFQAEEAVLLAPYVQLATSTPTTPIGLFLVDSAETAFAGYVKPSLHNELHRMLMDRAEMDAIRVFAENVRRVLLAPPFGPKVTLGVDPGLRTGCKIALVDKTGAFVTHTQMQILGDGASEKATKLFASTLQSIRIDAIAVGNGTAGRQTEIFLRKILKDLGKEKEVPVIMVSESGASVYSASDLAREEFPQLDVSVRGAVSIGRRLQDPLSELVKVDPKSIGVGQYQHDVNQGKLKKALEAVVESCVNQVGVDVNTASEQLLAFVSGIGPALAKSIVETRKQGLFGERDELLKVAKFSNKTYEQAAGFLRLNKGKQFLDSTGIHPERYQAVRDMAQELGKTVPDLVGEGAKLLIPLREKWVGLIGEYTFDDILRELEKPGRDPRDPFQVFSFRDDVFEVKDLKPGMICPGLVSNVTNFGAFVDVGVHQDGLVHISEISHQFVSDPRSVVNPGDRVTVRVLAVDLERNQISLSMKLEAAPARASSRERVVGDESKGEQARERAPRPSFKGGSGQGNTAGSATSQRDGSAGARGGRNSERGGPQRSPAGRGAPSSNVSGRDFRAGQGRDGALGGGPSGRDLHGRSSRPPREEDRRGGASDRPRGPRSNEKPNNPFGVLKDLFPSQAVKK